MGVKVSKFGGSSLANAKQFKKVYSIVMKDPKRRYIVPSAPGKRYPNDSKITDLLYLCHAHVAHSIPFGEVFDIISTRYLEIIEQLGISLDLKPYLEEIKSNIANGASLDYSASRGEYLNGIILSKYLDCDFIDPVNVIFFNEYGSLDYIATQNAVDRLLPQCKRAVIPGFYGCTPEGKVKLFPRGGSDITGAIIARGVNADVYENWTDVSGLLMADPSIVTNPKPISKITYRELRELSYMGAQVLHQETIFPVIEVGIPIHIKNTNHPQDAGTLIVNNGETFSRPEHITGIAGRKDFTVIAIEKYMMETEVGFVRKLLSILESNGIYFEHLPSGIDTLSLVVTDAQLDNKLEKVIREIRQQCNPDSITIHPNMALIATVGHGMAYTPGIAAKLCTALAKANVNIRMIDQGSSEINIIVGVETRDFEKAIQAIYNAFVK